MTGDLADHGADPEHAAAAELPAPLAAPVFVLPGNHDARAALVAIHHTPLRTGVPAWDAYRLDDGDRDRLAGVLAQAALQLDATGTTVSGDPPGFAVHALVAGRLVSHVAAA